MDKLHLLEMTAEIASAYVEKHQLPASELPAFIIQVHGALSGLGTDAAAEPASERPAPAVPIKKAVQPDYVVDLFTGKRFKSLKRHLRTTHNMTPEGYREYWGLPKDFPMVAPNYAAARSKLAKSMGLGQGGRGKAAAQDMPKTNAES